MTVPSRPGADLTVTLDLALQRDAAALFPDGRRGAFVALDPMTGAVLALYSRPTFDPNVFVEGFDPEGWERLRDDPGRPVPNPAIVAVAFVENGEHGSDAARYVSEVVDRFLARRFTAEHRYALEGLP